MIRDSVAHGRGNGQYTLFSGSRIARYTTCRVSSWTSLYPREAGCNSPTRSSAYPPQRGGSSAAADGTPRMRGKPVAKRARVPEDHPTALGVGSYLCPPITPTTSGKLARVPTQRVGKPPRRREYPDNVGEAVRRCGRVLQTRIWTEPEPHAKSGVAKCCPRHRLRLNISRNAGEGSPEFRAPACW